MAVRAKWEELKTGTVQGRQGSYRAAAMTAASTAERHLENLTEKQATVTVTVTVYTLMN